MFSSDAATFKKWLVAGQPGHLGYIAVSQYKPSQFVSTMRLHENNLSQTARVRASFAQARRKPPFRDEGTWDNPHVSSCEPWDIMILASPTPYPFQFGQYAL